MKKMIVLLVAIMLLLPACSGSVSGNTDLKMEEREAASNQSMISQDDTKVDDDAISQISYEGVPILSLLGVSTEEVVDALGMPGYMDGFNLEYKDISVSLSDSRVSGISGLAEDFTVNNMLLCMVKDEIIQIFGEPDLELDYSFYTDLIYSTSDYELIITVRESDYAEYISISVPSEVGGNVPSTDDDYSEDNGDYGNYGNYANLDYNLCGRWRSYDGGMLEFNDSGLITSCDFKCWSLILLPGEKPNRVYWEASNGRVTCSAYFDEDFIYEVHTPSSGSDHLSMKSITFSYGHDESYDRAYGTDGAGIMGIWESWGQAVQYNADGTGLFHNRFPFTWYEYTTDNGENAVSRSLLDSTYFDYSVMGNTLTVFLSDGSRTYTKVGN